VRLEDGDHLFAERGPADLSPGAQDSAVAQIPPDCHGRGGTQLCVTIGDKSWPLPKASGVPFALECRL
jgi:hypothetical protein